MRLDDQTRAELVGALGDELQSRLGMLPRPELLFDSVRNGSSLAALLRAAERTPASLLLLRERGTGSQRSRQFGAFCATGWSRAQGGTFGDARGFLFSVRDGTAAMLPAREADECFAHASSAHGIGFGGSVGAFGLGLEPGARRFQH